MSNNAQERLMIKGVIALLNKAKITIKALRDKPYPSRRRTIAKQLDIILDMLVEEYAKISGIERIS